MKFFSLVKVQTSFLQNVTTRLEEREIGLVADKGKSDKATSLGKNERDWAVGVTGFEKEVSSWTTERFSGGFSEVQRLK